MLGALKPFGIRVEQVQIELAESRSEDPTDIAFEKAKQAYALLKQPVIVEDSGFFVEGRRCGFPMTHVKFSLRTLGIRNILKMLKGVKNQWRMTVAFVYGKNKYKTFASRGRWHHIEDRSSDKADPNIKSGVYTENIGRNTKAV